MNEGVTGGESAEAKLRELNQQLSENIGRLETTLREVRSFSDLLSHEIKAPLFTVTQFSKRLDDEAGELLDEHHREFLRRILNAGRQMTYVLADVQDLADVTRARIRISDLHLGSLAREIIDDLRARFPKRNVVFQVDSGMTTVGDGGLLRILLTNLLQNSWKYTQPRDEARIEFRVRKDELGAPTYCVVDNGVGFDNRERQRIFEPFERLHSVQEFAGSGLGLATATRIIRRHGGEIWGDGELGRGATFCFTLGTSGLEPGT